MKYRKQIRAIAALLYFVFLTLGIIAAYQDKWIIAMFFAITCAGESIAVSIDYVNKDKDNECRNNIRR